MRHADVIGVAGPARAQPVNGALDFNRREGSVPQRLGLPEAAIRSFSRRHFAHARVGAESVPRGMALRVQMSVEALCAS